MNSYERRAALGFAAGLAAIAGAVLSLASAVAQRPEVTSLEVDATREGWVSTGITLGADEMVMLTATGTAGWEPGQSWGPAGAGATTCTLTVPNAPVGALLARTDGAVSVSVGTRTPVMGPGTVELLYNDCPGQYFDNIGGFTVAIQLPLPPATAQPTLAPATVQPVAVATANPEPVAPPAEVRSSGGGFPWLVVVVPLMVAAGLAGAWLKRGALLSPLARGPRFNETARLESSAWLAPARLRLLQSEKRGRRSLTIGGPDADIGFGVQCIWARLTPTEDGGVRLEQTKDAGRLLVDGLPVVLTKRLTDGARVFMGTREFVFRQERVTPFDAASDRGRHDVLSRPDPRAAAFMSDPPGGRDVA